MGEDDCHDCLTRVLVAVVVPVVIVEVVVLVPIPCELDATRPV